MRHRDVSAGHGVPTNLRDAGLSEEVVRYYDPNLFDWDHQNLCRYRGMFLSVRKDRSVVYISSEAAAILKEIAPRDDGYWWVEIGLSPRAIAIRAAKRAGMGYKVRQTRQKVAALSIACTGVIRKANLEAGRYPLEWDERSQMLVAKIPPQGKEGKNAS